MTYPPVAFSFGVAFVDQSQDLGTLFQEASGLDASFDVTATSEDRAGGFAHRLPVSGRQTTVTLKRGMITAQSELFTWVTTTIEGGFSTPIRPRSILISLLDQDQEPVMGWTLDAAWPVKLELSRKGASSSKVAVEKLEFAHRSITRKLIAQNQ